MPLSLEDQPEHQGDHQAQPENHGCKILFRFSKQFPQAREGRLRFGREIGGAGGQKRVHPLAEGGQDLFRHDIEDDQQDGIQNEAGKQGL